MLRIQLAKEGERTYIIFVSNISFFPSKILASCKNKVFVSKKTQKKWCKNESCNNFRITCYKCATRMILVSNNCVILITFTDFKVRNIIETRLLRKNLGINKYQILVMYAYILTNPNSNKFSYLRLVSIAY